MYVNDEMGYVGMLLPMYAYGAFLSMAPVQTLIFTGTVMGLVAAGIGIIELNDRRLEAERKQEARAEELRKFSAGNALSAMFKQTDRAPVTKATPRSISEHPVWQAESSPGELLRAMRREPRVALSFQP
ncbi:MAG TPA: hypothetical protein VIN59_02820 [Alphaproteobacteria bacterium]